MTSIRLSNLLVRSLHPTPFLDVLVTLHDDKLEIDLYSNHTDTFNKPTMGIRSPTSHQKQLSFKRICSTEETSKQIHAAHYISQTAWISTKTNNSAIKKALEIPRSQALQRHKSSKNQTERIPFVLTYNPSFPTSSKNTCPSYISLKDARKPYLNFP